MNDATDRLLDAALLHVPFEGMNDRALVAGARDIGISPDVARAMFPQGGAGLAAARPRYSGTVPAADPSSRSVQEPP